MEPEVLLLEDEVVPEVVPVVEPLLLLEQATPNPRGMNRSDARYRTDMRKTSRGAPQ